jgi:hydroxypyruvate reductase
LEKLTGRPSAESIDAARREMLRGIFRATLQAIDVRQIFTQNVRCADGWFHAADLRYRLADFHRVLVIAIGKAAVPSAEVVLGTLSDCVEALEAIVVGPGEMPAMRCQVEHLPGGHPVPTGASFDAARRIVDSLQRTSAHDLVIFLISGGASSMMELPLDPSLTSDEIAEFHRAIVHAGLSIAEMNALRKHLSAVKGGRLAELAAEAAKCTLLISDVPSGMPDVIGSGPSLPDSSTCEQCWELVRRAQLAGRLPQRVRALLESTSLKETPKPDAPCFARAEARIVLSSDVMLGAAADTCEQHGFRAVIDNTCDEWEYGAAADYLLERVSFLTQQHPRVCLLSGGEVLVDLSADAGAGGRNQQFALYCATKLNALPGNTTVMSVGTDGIDGNSPAAGALADRTTLERARVAGLDGSEALRSFNAYPLFAELGDAILTGPTGNNVRDLRILMVERSAS